MTMVLDSTSRLPHDLSHSSAGLGAVATVNTETVVVALVAGIAGMLAFETRAGQAVGVAISVTTIPAAALAGVAIALGSGSRALGSLKVLGTNVAMLLIGGTITLAIQKLLAERLARRPDPAPVSTGHRDELALRLIARDHDVDVAQHQVDDSLPLPIRDTSAGTPCTRRTDWVLSPRVCAIRR